MAEDGGGEGEGGRRKPVFSHIWDEIGSTTVDAMRGRRRRRSMLGRGTGSHYGGLSEQVMMKSSLVFFFFFGN